MLAEKKIHLAQFEIDFLGMHFSKGFYQPQKHIGEELLKFPDHSLTTKQIQQFLGILNYIRDFIPKAAKYTSPLSKLQKKNPPPWGVEQTEAVKQIKKIAQNPSALKIPGDGNRILQTYASDRYWGAVLIEEIHDKKFYCGHASGQFKEAEVHYHTTYKEALAVKNGIKKFDFHLRGFQFEILRLKDWFSRYDFTIKQIKGNKNLIPDVLSRPTKAFPFNFHGKTFTQLCLNPKALSPRTPKDILDYAKSKYFFFLHETLKFKVIHPSAFDPTNPNGNIFYLFCDIGWDLCEPTLWAIWCKTVQHPTPIALQTKKAYQILRDPLKHDFLFWTVLEWFSPITWWRSELEQLLLYQENHRKTNAQALVSIFIVYGPYAINPSGQLFSQNHAHTWGTFEEYPLNDNYERQLKGHLQETNLSSHSPSNMLIPSSSGIRQITVCSEYHIPAQLFQRTEDLVSPEESPDDLMDEDSDDPNLSPSNTYEPNTLGKNPYPVRCKIREGEEVAYFGVSMLYTCLFEGILCIRTLRIYGIFQSKYALHLPLQGDPLDQKTPNMKEQCNILADLDFQIIEYSLMESLEKGSKKDDKKSPKYNETFGYAILSQTQDQMVPEDAQISESSIPLLSPYNIFRRRRSSIRSIARLITSRRPPEKEFVQSSRMKQCSLVATPEEQYATIEIPKELIRHWQHEGYTHLHYGAIRLILSLHGRRGLPVSVRVSLLDSSFLHYENVVIGTVLTTLHAGSVVLTMFPNYNVSLRDPTVPQRLKLQVQITGAGQVAEALCATLHHQIIYRL
ncbi:hypothetical protein V8G54_034234 [Vigna mungo]|uniref:Reverse transcriptase/retrotransposon-derived protein RNase H-like domain-containing protein n=1 Tax=Vigna mungo TaxID=3915 RepID=A0AAQ3MPU5_VIGMU